MNSSTTQKSQAGGQSIFDKVFNAGKSSEETKGDPSSKLNQIAEKNNSQFAEQSKAILGLATSGKSGKPGAGAAKKQAAGQAKPALPNAQTPVSPAANGTWQALAKAFFT